MANRAPPCGCASAKAGNFYLRTKGETEDGLRALGFERLDILRPGLLTGERPYRLAFTSTAQLEQAVDSPR